MSHNITVEGGKSVRLLTAGKYCDRDIVVTATGVSEDLDAVLTEQNSLIDELKSVLRGKAIGGEAVIESLAVTENGTYTAQNGVDGYSPVTVNVPIPDGYIVPSGTLDVTENGTHDVRKYASVNVNVTASGGDTEIEDAILSNTIVGEYVNDRITYLGGYHFLLSKNLTSVSFPKVSSTGTNPFQQATALTNVSMPKLTRAANYMVYGCSALQMLDLPSLTAIGAAAMQACTTLTALILRSATLCKLENANALTRTPIADGTGYVYVPKALLSDDDVSKDYRRATNWSTYSAQFRAIEDYPEVCEVKA